MNKTTKTDIYKIDPRAIVVKEGFNSRLDFGDINELAEQIKAQGILNPITVKPFKDEAGEDKYELVDGERRYRAVLLLIEQGYTIDRVPALFSSKTLSEENALIQQLLRNEGKPFTEYELGIAFKKFIDMGLSHPEIAKKLGIAKWKVDCFLAHLNRDERIQQLMKEGKITGVDVRHIYQANKDEETAVKEILGLAKKAEKKEDKKISLKDLDENSAYNVVKDTAAIKKGLASLIMYIDSYSKGGKIDIELDIFDIFDKINKEKKTIVEIFEEAVKKATKAA